MEGELDTYRRGLKFPSAEGWRALRDGVVTIIENNVPERHHTRMPTATTGPRANIVCVGGSVGGGVSRKARRGVGIYYPARMRTRPQKNHRGHLPPVI